MKIAIKHRTNDCKDYMGSHTTVMTLNGLERRNGRLVCVISQNWVAFGPYYAKVVEDTPIHSASEMYVCMYLFYSSKNNTTEAL